MHNYKHLKHLALADNFNIMMSIDILVGIDFYYSFTTGIKVRGSDDPVAIKSSLGWILVGQSKLSTPIDSKKHFTVIP